MFEDAIAQAEWEIRNVTARLAEAERSLASYGNPFGGGYNPDAPNLEFIRRDLRRAIAELSAAKNRESRYQSELAEARRSDTDRNRFQTANPGQSMAQAPQEVSVQTSMDIAPAPIESAGSGSGQKSFAADLIGDPQRLRELVHFVELLMEAELKLIPANAMTNAFIIADQNIILPIPLKLSAPIADSTATVASVSAQLNLLLAALRRTGQLQT